MLGMPVVVGLLAPGMRDEPTSPWPSVQPHHLPYLLFISLASLMAAC